MVSRCKMHHHSAVFRLDYGWCRRVGRVIGQWLVLRRSANPPLGDATHHARCDNERVERDASGRPRLHKHFRHEHTRTDGGVP